MRHGWLRSENASPNFLITLCIIIVLVVICESEIQAREAHSGQKNVSKNQQFLGHCFPGNKKIMISSKPGGLECCAGSNFSCPETLHLCRKANKPAWHARLFCAVSFEPCLWKWSRIVCRRTSQSVLQPLQEMLLRGDCTFMHFCDRFNTKFKIKSPLRVYSTSICSMWAESMWEEKSPSVDWKGQRPH